MPKKTHVVLVLDRSGSMIDKKETTISALNEYIVSLQQGEKVGKLKFTAVQFDDEGIDTVHNAVPIADVEPWTNETFVPRGLTPLYDAIGNTVINMNDKRRVLFVIMTDGLENASQEWDRERVFNLIKKMKKKNWTFIFLGADQDAFAVGYELGISKLNTQCYAGGQEQNLMAKVARGTVSHTTMGYAASEEFFEEDKD